MPTYHSCAKKSQIWQTYYIKWNLISLKWQLNYYFLIPRKLQSYIIMSEYVHLKITTIQFNNFSMNINEYLLIYLCIYNNNATIWLSTLSAFIYMCLCIYLCLYVYFMWRIYYWHKQCWFLKKTIINYHHHRLLKKSKKTY